MTKEKGKRKEPAHELMQHFDVIHYYTEYLRYQENKKLISQARAFQMEKGMTPIAGIFGLILPPVHNPYPLKWSPEYEELAQKAYTFLEELYQGIQDDITRTLEQGETKVKSTLEIIGPAFGSDLFDVPWVRAGLKAAYARGKKIEFPRFKAEQDYPRVFQNMLTLERRARRKQAGKPAGTLAALGYEYSGGRSARKQLYEDLPKFAQIWRLHFCHRLLHKDGHELLFEEVPPIKSQKALDTLKKAVQKTVVQK
jgi:hypothetical protein